MHFEGGEKMRGGVKERETDGGAAAQCFSPRGGAESNKQRDGADAAELLILINLQQKHTYTCL